MILADRLTVDVVVNNHNYERFVAAAVESALAQTHAHVRVIVVDDGSTDRSRELLRNYESKVDLVLKPNGGQASALNAGFNRVEGEVVLFLDADDVLRPDAAASIAVAFAADPRVVKVQHRMEVIDEMGRRTGAIKPHRHLPLPDGDLRDAELTFPFDLAWLPTSGNAFRTDVLRSIFPIPEQEFARCADWYLVHLTPLLGRVVSLDNIGAYYRVHGANRYEPQRPALDLLHVRETIRFAASTIDALDRLAFELRLTRPYATVLSVSDLSNRLVSLRLDPELHPIPADTVARLAVDGIRAALRRFDVAWPMKFLLSGWFGFMAVAPRPVARRLAEAFLFPERRRKLSRVVERFHRVAPGTDVPAT
jgi:glycosyltransferase involved in cell wall biosynthesis